jgi:hypothetical protein
MRHSSDLPMKNEKSKMENGKWFLWLMGKVDPDQ